jgi:hypothetical protein
MKEQIFMMYCRIIYVYWSVTYHIFIVSPENGLPHPLHCNDSYDHYHTLMYCLYLLHKGCFIKPRHTQSTKLETKILETKEQLWHGNSFTSKMIGKAKMSMYEQRVHAATSWKIKKGKTRKKHKLEKNRNKYE